ncbi:class I SAM-dependent methyltransferase [Pseudoroseicyclus aestuarii]|uniref:Ubiquinone/menaquinone biosynthesis C-methylase UbiE n=1 Tax=Pseudoroseicyclus aestuarii TaxID=1795041 RepID=A0A318SQN0_9RHOB|nr:class I SAM-dependent methyltransferase [Pseudoroseicyclus aestuarii]PYE83992.1 ubiquinone/menaquinone biosynthesis C-methylase UbiE [Pseudoroseicyclus aestuarii]
MTRPAAGQAWDAAGYAANAGFVPALGTTVLERLAPQPGEAILDIGCGDGVLTARIAEAGATVTGLEPDPSLAAAAGARGIAVLQQDAHDQVEAGPFDAVFSNAALHWMRRPEVVLGNIHAALRPGGRVVVEQGGFGNVAAVLVALNASLEAAGEGARTGNPWDFPTPALQRDRLERAGFTEIDVALVPRPTPLPTGLRGWLQTFGAPLMEGLAPTVRESVIADCERRLAPVLQDETGNWVADYVRLRFEARRPA